MSDNFNSDVSHEGVEAFFGERDPDLAKAVNSMESVESWTRDRIESVQTMLQQLADRVEYADVDDEEQFRIVQNKLIVLLGYISSGKAIKLLMWTDQAWPNFVARTLAEAQLLAVMDKVNEESARLFVERFEVLEKLHMLSRIFAEDRLKIVQKVLRILAGEESGDEEYGDD
jgi:intracellular multiplication protein IcmW